MQSRLDRAAVVAMLLVVGCSGKTADGPVQVRFSPAALSSSFTQGDDVAGVDLAITFSPALPGDPLAHSFWFEQQPEWVLDLTKGYGPNPEPGSWRMRLFPSCALEPGVHEGTLTFRVHDVTGAEVPLTGNVLPYTFTVSAGVAPPRVTALVDGVPLPGFATICGLSSLYLSVTAGQTVKLTSTVPVAWTTVGGPPCYPSAVNVGATETTWTGTIAVADCPASNVFGGSFGVTAAPASDPARQIELGIEVLTR